jgi:hypothetical protein
MTIGDWMTFIQSGLSNRAVLSHQINQAVVARFQSLGFFIGVALHLLLLQVLTLVSTLL